MIRTERPAALRSEFAREALWAPAGATVTIVTRHRSGKLRVNYSNGYHPLRGGRGDDPDPVSGGDLCDASEVWGYRVRHAQTGCWLTQAAGRGPVS